MSDRDVQRRIRALKAEIAQLKGERLLTSQAEDIDWYRREIREEVLAESLLALNKQTYCQMASKSRATIDDHGRRFGLPLNVPKIDLFKVIKALHDLLEKHKKTLENADDATNLAAEKIKMEVAQVRRKAELLDLEVLQKKKKLVDRNEVIGKLVWVSEKLRSLGERLGKVYGQDAQLAVNEYLEEMALEVESGKLRIGEDA